MYKESRINFLTFFIIILCFLNCISKAENLDNDKSEFKVDLSEDEKFSTEFIQALKVINDSINEPELKDLDYESYRFTYVDSFRKHKLFRVNYYGDYYTELVVKLFESESDYKTHVLKSEIKIDLSKEQSKEFKKLIQGSYFWSMETSENPIPMYLDGYTFVLEGFLPKNKNNNARTHTVFRVVPKEGSFREACEKLIEFYEKSKILN